VGEVAGLGTTSYTPSTSYSQTERESTPPGPPRSPWPREVSAHRRADFPFIGHVAHLGCHGQSCPTRRTADLREVGFWHPRCLPARMRQDEGGTAMARIIGALITAIFVAVALLGWITMRM